MFHTSIHSFYFMDTSTVKALDSTTPHHKSHITHHTPHTTHITYTTHTHNDTHNDTHTHTYANTPYTHSTYILKPTLDLETCQVTYHTENRFNDSTTH